MSGTEVPLILGGHPFISQLGNDPPASEREQRRIVEACLDHGIRWFDTTYQPKRVALGNVLRAVARLGSRRRGRLECSGLAARPLQSAQRQRMGLLRAARWTPG